MLTSNCRLLPVPERNLSGKATTQIIENVFVGIGLYVSSVLLL